MVNHALSPKEFLKQRRPEKFSDSQVHQRPGLDRSQLEYHLDTLTSRSQENAFEQFAKAISQREVCPNLIPHTGPTGGGDSKVDSETFPVSDAIASGWYCGIGREASQERWAFAFSAKKDWKAKVKADVRNLASTNRDYKKCFFVTNQFVRDKLRASTEDALSREHGLDVRIFDRTWLLDATFQNDYVQLAIDTLGISTPSASVVVRGPLDVQREQDLSDIEKRIKERLATGSVDIPLIEDCLEAALLSRELERPRTETDGRFDRACRIAQKLKNVRRRVEATYQWAWTTFWWFEDYLRFSSLMGNVSGLATNTNNIHDLQLLCNLWQLLHSSVIRGEISKSDAAHQTRTDFLLRELDRFCANGDRPSASLHAKTLRLEIELSIKTASRAPIDDTLRSLQQIVVESTGLLGYPLEPLVPICTHIGEFLGGNPAYESLFETILGIASNRRQEVNTGELLRKRGMQALEANRPQDAIRMFGRSFRLLYKDESRDECVRAMYACAFAYERLGLLWAARGVLLSAASIAAEDFWKYGELTPLQAGCFLHLKWIELALGRIPQALCWHEVDIPVRAALESQEKIVNVDLAPEQAQFDVTLGILLLAIDVWTLKYLTRLPNHLDELGLPAASLMLIHALGQTDRVSSQHIETLFGSKNLNETLLEYRDASRSWRASVVEIGDARSVQLCSQLLGCEITVAAKNERPCIEVAESFLAAIESLLSTAPVTQLVSREPTLDVSINLSESLASLVEYDLEEHSGKPSLVVQASRFDPNSLSADQQTEINNKLVAAITKILGRVFIGDAEVIVSNLGKEDAIGRAINFTGSFMRVASVLGNNPKTRISDWARSVDPDYPLVRWESWDADSPLGSPTPNVPRSFVPGNGAPPEELTDQANTNHRAIRTISVVREALWKEARWVGTAFLTVPDDEAIPVMMPIFRNSAPAAQIFKFWREEFGAGDSDERLRISIVRGISNREPHAYRVFIAPAPQFGAAPQKGGFEILVGRTNAMLARDPENLNRFLRSYDKCKAFFLNPAVSEDRDLGHIEPIRGAHIKMEKLSIRDAWEIGPNDLDSPSVHDDDDPIIPEGQTHAPVLMLLRQKRRMREQRQAHSVDL
jgi:hypothetical protein